jgi:hypothetical protein
MEFEAKKYVTEVVSDSDRCLDSERRTFYQQQACKWNDAPRPFARCLCMYRLFNDSVRSSIV